jgi:hypothetical protein
MSSTKIPDKIVLALWTRAGGRCQYEGCNKPLWRDGITFAQVVRGYLAHVVADSPAGPRGHPVRSPQLAKAVDNLMLLCADCHKRVDVDEVDAHPEEQLLAMKAEHELRIERVTGIGPDLQTQLVVFRAPIGDDRTPLERGDMRRAVIAAGRYPQPHEVTLDLALLPMCERTEEFWKSSRDQIHELFERQVQWRLAGSVPHFSVFGLAPIPLLIAFGKLLGDRVPMHVYQRHREPAGWSWPRSEAQLEFHLVEPEVTADTGDVALVLSISDSVQTSDILAAAPPGAPVYEIRVDDPRRDCVRSREDARSFATVWQRAQDVIRARYRESTPRIHLFPAIPNSIAIECGRVLLAKTHSPLLIYDHNREIGGFRFTFEL